MFTASYPSCPNCKRRLRGGVPSFGPAQVECNYCGTTFKTGFLSWKDEANTGFGRRIGIILKELIIPTCMGYEEFQPRFLLNAAWMLLTLGLPIIAFIRLISMIKESNEFDETSVPPKWEWIFRPKNK